MLMSDILAAFLLLLVSLRHSKADRRMAINNNNNNNNKSFIYTGDIYHVGLNKMSSI